MALVNNTNHPLYEEVNKANGGVISRKVAPKPDAEKEAMMAEIAKLKAMLSRKIKLQVSEKGALSLYGIGRFPVSLYAEQWEVVLDHADEIREALKSPDLKRKG